MPEVGVGRGPNKPGLAGMHVPKAAVNKHDASILWKYDIGGSRQIPTVQPETATHSVKSRSDTLLWCRVFPANTGHVPASAGLGNAIRHYVRVADLLGKQTGIL